MAFTPLARTLPCLIQNLFKTHVVNSASTQIPIAPRVTLLTKVARTFFFNICDDGYLVHRLI